MCFVSYERYKNKVFLTHYSMQHESSLFAHNLVSTSIQRPYKRCRMNVQTLLCAYWAVNSKTQTNDPLMMWHLEDCCNQ